jgi:hypothetical protein
LRLPSILEVEAALFAGSSEADLINAAKAVL